MPPAYAGLGAGAGASAALASTPRFFVDPRLGGACVPLRSTESRILGTPSKSVTRIAPPLLAAGSPSSSPPVTSSERRAASIAAADAPATARAAAAELAGSGFASPFWRGVRRSVGRAVVARGGAGAAQLGRRAGRAAHLALAPSEGTLRIGPPALPAMFLIGGTDAVRAIGRV